MKEKTGKTVRRIGAIAMSTVMSFALIPSLQCAPEVKADWTKNQSNTKLGTSQIANPKIQTYISDPWVGSYVYYGHYENTPLKFRVLDKETSRFGNKSIFLDCDNVLYTEYFSMASPSSAVWADSTLKTSLNGGGFLTRPSGFQKPEIEALTKSKVSAHALTVGTENGNVAQHTKDNYGSSIALTGEKVFVLDIEEASNTAYGYDYSTNNWAGRAKKDLSGNPADAWTRSIATQYTAHVGCVGGSSGGISFAPASVLRGVSPAMNVSLDSILFSSLISGTSGKPGAEYKLTVIDNNISISLQDGRFIDVSDNQVSVPYIISGFGPGYLSQISVMILDRPYIKGNLNNSSILYYSCISDGISERGLVTFDLPSNIQGIMGEDYFVYVFTELVNGPYETDTASVPYEIKPVRNEVFDLTSGQMEDTSNIKYAMTLMALTNDSLIDVYAFDGTTGPEYYLDLDRNGTYDVHYEMLTGIYRRMDSCNIFGSYVFDDYEPYTSNGETYDTITFKLPVCKPAITTVEPTDNGVQVKWNKVSYYSAYNVYRSTSENGTYSYLASVTGGTTKYTDKTAKGGKTYYYKVRPYTKCVDINGQNRTIYATWSDAAKVVVLADTKLTAEPKSGVTMTLSWTAVSGATSYEIYRATSASGPYTYVKATTGTSTSDTGLKAGTRYYYMVRAKKTVNGVAQYSKYSAAVAVALATPTMESAVFKSGKGVTLKWTKASGADRYNVYKYNTSTGKYDYVASVLGGTLTYTDTNGKKGDYYKVRAYKRVDGVVYYGGWSNAKAGK